MKIGQIFIILGLFSFIYQKPIIVCVPQHEKPWNLGDILKKMNDNSTKGLQSNLTKNTISKSNLDLSSPGTEILQRSQSQANVRQVLVPACIIVLLTLLHLEKKFLRLLFRGSTWPLSSSESLSS